ncbi:MAG: hypothetical protein HFJ65_04985 [Eggerthellaceae bacterium]|nr:hypothetical protein [Eggerthellaceae bacterium]
MAEYLGDGIYRIGTGQRIWSCRKDVMEDAVAPVEPGVPPAGAQFGWFKGAIPTPQSGGFYVVEFLPDKKARVLAYVDMFGRAFTTQEGFQNPPAQMDDLQIVRLDEPDEGVILIRNKDGQLVECARYVMHGSGQNAKYDITDTWYDFKGHDKRLHYYDLMTRAYLAFVYRPTLGSATLPMSISDVHGLLTSADMLTALSKVIRRAESVKADPTIALHPLIERLADRLDEANIPELANVPGLPDALRLVRTKSYADTYYVAIEGEDLPLSQQTAWELEASLNLFALSASVMDALSEKNSIASLDSCESFLVEGAATQTPSLDLAVEFPKGEPGGQWEAWSRIAAGIENMVLPLRVDATFAIDPVKRIARFKIRVPNASMFEDLFYSGKIGQAAEASAEAKLSSEAYAMRIGLLLADIAFRSSELVGTVELIAEEIPQQSDGSPSATAILKAPLFDASFTREEHAASDGFAKPRREDPHPLFANAAPSDALFEVRMETDADVARMMDEPLPERAARAFGADSLLGIQINFGSELASTAWHVADSICQAESTSSAIATIREIQDGLVPGIADPLDLQDAFNRLMAALAEGSVDAHDSIAVATCFIGGDDGISAYQEARRLAEGGQTEAAISTLRSLIQQVDLSGRYMDDDAVIYRTFDSYPSRLIYDLAKAGRLASGSNVPFADDAGKETRLMPDSYFLASHMLGDLLSDSFESSEDALQVAKRTIHVAPTIGVGYRLLGRTYMLMGDMQSAASALMDGLQIMAHPDDISSAYYQLAYVLWKSGDAKTGLAAYAKSLVTSQVMAEACMEEMQELQQETGLDLPPKDDLDSILASAGIPVAPTKEVQAGLREAAVAAIDEGLLRPGASYLVCAYNATKDDALANVLRSLA